MKISISSVSYILKVDSVDLVDRSDKAALIDYIDDDVTQFLKIIKNQKIMFVVELIDGD